MNPHSDPLRPWLRLLEDEVEPVKSELGDGRTVVWSSFWTRRPDARVTFELAYDSVHQGTDLTWTMSVSEPIPDASLLGHLRFRINFLINGELRGTYGQ